MAIKKALIIGGTRGIGAATAEALRARGWAIVAAGRATYDVHRQVLPMIYARNEFDALVFCAGDLDSMFENAFDYPVAFYRTCITRKICRDGAVIVAVSSVAADRPAKVNPHYAAAKAALESYARTLADSDMARQHGWRVEVIRFDLVDTDMLRQLPAETLKGRDIISAETAARQILTLMGVEL